MRRPQRALGAFNNRGVAYNDKHEYDRVIQDFDHAIRVDPNYALHLNAMPLGARGRQRRCGAAEPAAWR